MAFDFDYYLIDEIMSVGDASFKAKSRKVFDERMKKANIILVSHDMNTIRRMCNLIVHLVDGQPVVYEDIEAGVQAYIAGGAEL
jgi:capsular polysaccharide transport system ATP-binding protein